MRAFIILAIGALVGLMIGTTPSPAHAGYYKTSCDFLDHCYKTYVRTPPKRHSKKNRGPRRDDDEDDNDRYDKYSYYASPNIVHRKRFECADKVRGLGTQWIGTEGAMDAAKKDWMERVRYDYGETFLDMANSKQFESRCGRVSIGETMGQVMYRCEIVARPCQGDMKESTGTTK